MINSVNSTIQKQLATKQVVDENKRIKDKVYWPTTIDI